MLAATTEGQELQNTVGTVTISSPTAASLGKFGDIPVSYHTGVPNVDIPLYTVKAGPLSLPISMSYHASGLKVMEPAGWVGAGWALNAGGVITRTVVGQPDERGANSGFQEDGHYTQNGFNSYLYGGTVQDWQGFAQGRKDGEPDMYFFNFGGYSGKFYFRDDRTPILVPQQDLKIVPVFTGGRSFDYFTITTPDGTQYLFGNAPGVSGTAPVEYTNCYSAKNGAVGFPPVSSWFLSKIISADNQFSINLTYQPESYGYFTISMFPVEGWKTGNDGLGYDLVKDLIQGVRLSQISFPNGTVSFIPGDVRTDLSDNVQSISDGLNNSAVTLAAVKIADLNGNFCKNFNFSYDYFSGDNMLLPNALTFGTSINTDKQKLKLNSIQEVSCDGSIQAPPYKFTYASEFVPRRLSFGVDHWGYYNGQRSNAGLIPTITANGSPIEGANRDASWPEMLDGALTRIDYPTGGHDDLEFESNSGYVTVTTPVTNHLAQFAFHVFGQSATSGTGTFTSNGNDITIKITTNCNFGGPLSIVNSSGQSVYFITFSNTPNYNDNTPVTSNLFLVGSQFPPGTYTVTASLNAGPNDNIVGGVSIDITQPDVTSETVLKTLGGIRIKTLSKSDAVTSTVQQMNYTYSGAILYSQPTYAQIVRNDLIANLGYWTASSGYSSSLFVNGCPGVGLYYKSPGSLRPMASFDGSIIGYLTVTTSQPGNGRTEYYYATPSGGYSAFNNLQMFNNILQTAACDLDIPNYPSAPLPYDPYKGLLTGENHYDANGKQVKYTSYSTTFDQSPTLNTPGFIVTTADWGQSKQLLGTFYNLNTARTVSKIVQETTYDNNNTALTRTSTTYFESPYHNMPTRTVTQSSKGDVLTTKKTYAMDYRLGSCDAISDCSSEYNSNCTSCLNTYHSAQLGCNNNSNCLTLAYLTYQQCLTNARISYVGCRNTNYTGPGNSFTTCHSNAESTADNTLQPVLKLQDIYENAPIEVSQWRNSDLMGAGLTAYGIASSPVGFPYPAKTYSLNLQATSSTFAPTSISGNSLSQDGRYQQESILSIVNGNPISVTPHDGITSSYIWDYKNAEAIAKIINATADQAAYTSFESDGTGNWTVPLGGRISGGITGRQFYNLPNGDCQKGGLNSGASYVVSYWSKGGSYSVSGSTATIQGRTVNGWTYYEHKVSGVSSVIIHGTDGIDELRIYPSNAQMTTFTYDPLVGMTSQCDINNRISYYSYDALDRLQVIKDQDGNVVKSIDYHYKGQTAP